MKGMTLKQAAKVRFFRLCELYKQAAQDTSEESRSAFIRLSVHLHIAKGSVPKSYWKYARI